MPNAAPRPCRRYPCPHLEPCPVHTVSQVQHQRDRERGAASERGYDWRWRLYSKRRLREFPLCAECERQGLTTLAKVTDHIIPPTTRDDPKFWEPDNHQSLCYMCNNIKARRQNTESYGAAG